MTDHDDSAVAPLRRRGEPDDGVRRYHGPVRMTEQEGGIQVLTFDGGEEADVLHAAGAWMAEHPFARLVATNWKGDLLYLDDEDKPADVPRHRFELVVDLNSERMLTPPANHRT